MRARHAAKRALSAGVVEKGIRLDVTTLCNYTVSVRYEWEEAKRQANIQKHGIDFIGIERGVCG